MIGSGDREERLDRILAEYLEAVRAGRAPSRRELLRLHPDLAADIEKFLCAEEKLGDLALPLRATFAISPGLAPGASLGDYDLEAEIARGGMGVVYRARHRRLKREVALKTLLAGASASDSARRRFRREAEVIAGLEHPNIVPIYEVGESEGHPFFAMRLMEGGSLAERRGVAPPDYRGLARLVETVARAVHYAHQRGILHRDLKPANILLDSRGEPQVTDFGLAALLESESGLTRTGETLGTPAYMAPEQAAGCSRDVSTATDVYSLGAILYDLLAHRPPFREETVFRTLQAVVEKVPAPPRSVRPDVPRDLEVVCLKCLEKEPGRRYESAQALADDLQRFHRGEAILARRAGTAERFWTWCRRNPTAIAVVAVLLAAAGVASTSALFWRAENIRSIENLHRSHLNLARAMRTSAEPGRRFQGLESLAAAARIRPTLQARNEAVGLMTLADIQVHRRWAGHPEGTTAVGFDHRLERYARASNGKTVSLREVDGDREIAALEGQDGSYSLLVFDSTGKYLLGRAHNRFQKGKFEVWDLEAKRTVFRSPDLVSFSAVDFHPEGRAVASASPEGDCSVIEVPSGRILKSLRTSRGLQWLRYDPSGRRIAVVADSQPRIELLDPEHERIEKTIGTPSGVSTLAWHPGGDVLALGCADFKIRLYSASKGKELKVFSGHINAGIATAFSPDGYRLASTGWDGTWRLWDPSEGRQLISISVGGGYSAAFSSDGTRLGVLASTPDLLTFQVAAGSEFRTILHALGEIRALQQSRDGRLLAGAGERGVILCDAARGETTAVLAIGACYSIDFDPKSEGFRTCGAAGAYFWPLERLDAQEPQGGNGLQGADRVRVGPPVLLAPRAEHLQGSPNLRREDIRLYRAAYSADGSLGAAVLWGKYAVVSDLNDPARKPVVVEHSGIHRLSLSGDGRWLATAVFHGKDIKIWDARAGGPEVAILPAENSLVHFAPGGRWLIAARGREYIWIEVGTWQVRRVWKRDDFGVVAGEAVVSGDGKTLAIHANLQEIALLDLETGDELCRLRSPVSDSHVAALSLNADGSRLVARDQSGILVWDLRAIRGQLSVLGLDWNRPPFPPPPDPARPLRVEVELGVLAK